MERGAALFDGCGPCHGVTGEGSLFCQAPAIAGLPSWYVESQLENFQSGLRGAHPEDIVGIRMRSMARMLNHEGDIESVAAYVSAMPPSAPDDVLDGTVSSGEVIFQLCAACHGPDVLSQLIGRLQRHRGVPTVVEGS